MAVDGTGVGVDGAGVGVDGAGVGVDGEADVVVVTGIVGLVEHSEGNTITP